jgi:hypothetical protein
VAAENARQTQAAKLGVGFDGDQQDFNVTMGKVSIKKDKNALETMQEQENLQLARKVAELEDELREKSR